MASTEFRYPDTTSPTATWVPAHDPVLNGSADNENTGIAAQLAADNVTQHAEQLSSAYSKYVLAFSGLSSADKAAMKTFAAAVKGAKFYAKDCGQLSSSFIPVRFAREGFQRTWAPQAGSKWAVTVVLVDAPS